MKSVRVLAGGAVTLFALSFMTAPVRACDDRFLQKCEAEAEAAFLAEQGPAAATVSRRKPQRMRAAVPEKPTAEKRSRPVRLSTKPAATQEPAPAPAVATANERPVAQPESPMARRFRGFIDPQSMSVNSFEGLRRPRLDPEHLAAAPTLPAADISGVASTEEPAVPDATTAVLPAKVQTVAPPQPAATPIAVAQADTVRPVLAQTFESPAGGDDQPGGFPLRQLVLALCGALGVASALRFIVRA